MKLDELKNMSIKQLTDLRLKIFSEPIDQSTNAKMNMIKKVLLKKISEMSLRRREIKDMGTLGIEGFIELRDKMDCDRSICFIQVRVCRYYNDQPIKVIEVKGDKSIIQFLKDYRIEEIDTLEIKEIEEPLVDWDC